MTAILLILLLSCCQEKRTLLHPMYMWDASDNPRFDSLRIELQDAYYHGLPFAEKQKRMEKLSMSLSEKERKNPSKKEVLDFWKFRLATVDRSSKEVAETINKRLEGMDSVKRPYNYYMMQSLLFYLPGDAGEKYLKINRSLKYFRSQGDSLMAGKLLIEMARLFHNFVDTTTNARAQGYYRLADGAFRGCNAEIYRQKNLLNMAEITNADSTIDSIYTVLRASEIAMADTMFYEIVLRNSHLAAAHRGDSASIKYIDENLRRLSQLSNIDATYPGKLAVNYALESAYSYSFKKDYDQALKYAKTAEAMLDSVTPTNIIRFVLETLAHIYLYKNVKDSALYYTNEAYFWRDSLQNERGTKSLIQAETAVKIAGLEKENAVQRVKNYLLVAIFIAALIIAWLIVMYLADKHKKEREIDRLKSQVEIDRQSSSLAAKSLVLAEKTRMIENLETTIRRLREEGKLSAADSKNLTVALKLHTSSEDEREGFLEVHDKLNPDFTKRLKRDFPALSEAQLRLAAYIASGLTNSQIGRMLNIEHGSVKTNRYRLRGKLGLSTGDSLEDFLRRYTMG